MSTNEKASPFRGDPKIASAINELDRNLPAILQHVALIAEVKRKYFIALRGEGFTEAQALELCKHPTSL